ncbi:hypothetical protein [Puniceibacterium confluentis]|nr:hypothetical protein [Puniceibacterium confluentis]
MLALLARTYLRATYQRGANTPKGGYRWSADDMRQRYGGYPND